jgi:catechol 2,3-dioxygenase-like lactoylglutathione lyase family enzyme
MQATIKILIVYTPAKDFALSKRFYTGLGFELTEGWGKTMDCRLGGAFFGCRIITSKTGLRIS